MKKLLAEATEAQKKVINYVIANRDSRDQLIGVASAISFQLSQAPALTEARALYDKLLNSFIAYRYKKCRVALGNLLAEPNPPYARMKEITATFLSDLQTLRDVNLLSEGSFQNLSSIVTQANAAIDARERGEKPAVQFSSTPGQVIQDAKCIGNPKGARNGLFYLKDNTAAQFVRAQGATVTQTAEVVSITSGAASWTFEADVAFKISKGKFV